MQNKICTSYMSYESFVLPTLPQLSSNVADLIAI